MQLQKFGLEIRKIGRVDNLYADVDLVLKNANMESGGVSQSAQAQTCAHALQRMLSVESHFSVCTIDRCAKMCQVCISKERQQIYDAAHCLHWNEMLPDYRTMLVAMILDDFRTVLNPA